MHHICDLGWIYQHFKLNMQGPGRCYGCPRARCGAATDKGVGSLSVRPLTVAARPMRDIRAHLSNIIATDFAELQKGQEKIVSSFGRAFLGGGFEDDFRLPIAWLRPG